MYSLADKAKSPSQGSLTRRWHIIRESARQRGAIVDSTGEDLASQMMRTLKKNDRLLQAHAGNGNSPDSAK